MRKILIADDEPNLVATLKFNLEKEGYGVLTAGDGEEAVSARTCWYWTLCCRD
jgi:DNA-binding response OmpR family regulator